MEVTIMITPKGNIHKLPIVTFRGLPVNDTEEFLFGLENEIENASKTFSMNSKKQEFNLINTLKIVCRKYSKEKTGKKPYTNINLVRI
jgi:ribonuclease J